MSEKDINRWQDTVTPRDLSKLPWTLGPGGSWDMIEVQPIPDSMLAELAQRFHYAGTPWNCRSVPLSDADREYMYLLYYSMQGLVARMVQAEKREDIRCRTLAMMIRQLCSRPRDWQPREPDTRREEALELLRSMDLMGSPLRDV